MGRRGSVGVSLSVPLAMLIVACQPNLPDITGPLDLIDIKRNIHVVGADEAHPDYEGWNQATAWEDALGVLPEEPFDARYRVSDEETINSHVVAPSYAGALSAEQQAVFGDSVMHLYGTFEGNEKTPDNVVCPQGDILDMIDGAYVESETIFLARSPSAPESEDDGTPPLVLIFVPQERYDAIVSPYCPNDDISPNTTSD